jgi:hypothetical protein
MRLPSTAIKLAVTGLLTAAGGLALGADQFSAIAKRLEDALEPDAHTAVEDVQSDPTDTETAAERADDDGYPLGRSGAAGTP